MGMHKHIVLFSDGTGNSSASLFKTNVRRLYEALDLADPQNPPLPRQFAFYDDGVGTSTFRPLKLLGGAVGWGLARNVRDLYAFLCRTYSDGGGLAQPDEIFAFGFSRGAFTIRVLIGLVMNQGLVRYNGSEADLQRDVAAAYRAYRKARFHTAVGTEVPFRKVRDWLLGLRDRAAGRKPYDGSENIGRPDTPGAIRVKFVGIWDTVDAYGLPVDELTQAVNSFVWPLQILTYDLNDRVRRARHALALDDERNAFHPRLWDEAKERPDANRATTHTDQERISQVWFAGVHANVGGGYPDDSLAHVSLEWMMTEASKPEVGLRFSKAIWDRFRALQDDSGPIYDSRRGLAGYYRYNPRRIEWLTNTDKVQVPRPKVHASVLRRIRVGQDGYAPFVLPGNFAVVMLDGEIIPSHRLAEVFPHGWADDAPGPLGSSSDCQSYEQLREHVWNWVWWRRVVYFLTFATTMFLVVMPLALPALPKGACDGRLCFLSGAIDAVGAVLPGFAAVWTDAFSSRPGTFLAVVSLVGSLIWLGTWLERRIRDRMRAIWYRVPELNPRAAPIGPPEATPGPLNQRVERLRLQPAYRKAFRMLTRWVLPTAFLLGLFYLGIASASRLAFAVRASNGYVCVATEEGKRAEVQDRLRDQGFQTSEHCAPTGHILVKGAAYRVRVMIPADHCWRDNGILAGPNGVPPAAVTWPMSLGVPLRRHITQPWYKPMARIGALGSDVYPLDPKPPVPSDGPESKDCALAGAGVVFEAELVARTGDELFLYVNDAVPNPLLGNSSYANNTGRGHVTVERLVPPPP